MQCKHIKKGGVQCLSPSLLGAEFCYWHSTNPEITQLRQEKARLGGKHSHISDGEGIKKSLLKLETPEKVPELIRFIIQETAQDRLDLRKGNFLIAGLKEYLKTLEFVDLEKRIKKLEKEVYRNG